MSNNQKKPIIIDLGSSEIKAGFFGIESPNIRIQNIIGEPLSKIISSQLTKAHYISSECDNNLNNLKIRYPIQRGVFKNDDDIQLIFDYIFSKMELNNEQIKEHPLIISEPINNKKSNSEKIAETLFEKFNISSLIFARQPLLSLISTGYSSGIILESGSDITQSCVSYEGYLIENSFNRFDYGGRDVTNVLKILIEKNNPYLNQNLYNNINILNEIKENHCYIKILKQNNDLNNENGDFTSIDSEYILPDRSKLILKDEKILAPEILFNNKLIFAEYLPFHKMIINSINKVDINIKNKLYETTILSGGNTKFKKLIEKIKINLMSLIPGGVQLKIRTQEEPELNCWKGGNIIASLSSFNKILVDKKQWEEFDKNIIHTKNI